jgi:hypothetical protein
LRERQACKAKNLVICELGRWDHLGDVSVYCSELIRDCLPVFVAMPEFPSDAIFTVALYE